MNNAEVRIFIEEMRVNGDEWTPDKVKRKYGNSSLVGALCDRRAQLESKRNKKKKRKRVVAGILLIALFGFTFAVHEKKRRNSFECFLENASDVELEEARERVRSDFNYPDREAILRSFDDEMSNRAWGGKEPQGPAFHREHGWYLSNDDT